jgi:hypothetical protein
LLPSLHKKPPSSIPFVSRANKVDGPDADKSELEFLMDPKRKPASGSKYFQKFAIFKDGCKSQRSGGSRR